MVNYVCMKVYAHMYLCHFQLNMAALFYEQNFSNGRIILQETLSKQIFCPNQKCFRNLWGETAFSPLKSLTIDITLHNSLYYSNTISFIHEFKKYIHNIPLQLPITNL